MRIANQRSVRSDPDEQVRPIVDHREASTDARAGNERSATLSSNPVVDETIGESLDSSIENADLAALGDNCSLLAISDGFVVNDGDSAAWVVRKIVEARAHAARVRAWAATELRRAEREETWFLDRFGPQLEGWLRSELERQGGRRRSIALPPGTLGLRQQPARLEVVDEARVAAWCTRSCPEALRVVVEAEGDAALELSHWHGEHADQARHKTHVLRDPLGRHLVDVGELPEGTRLQPARDALFVK